MSRFSEDITFCPLTCDNMECMRNSANIQDHTIPHSYSVEVPDCCPKRQFTTSLNVIGNNAAVNRKSNEWISVEEKLPELFVDVLAYDSDRKIIRVANVSYGGHWAAQYGGIRKITHWMPLPKPPKG